MYRKTFKENEDSRQDTVHNNRIFSSVAEHVKNTAKQLKCSGAAVYVIHEDTVVLEEYYGRQSELSEARAVQEDTQFHAASVRKSYIGFAAAYAIHYGHIKSLDDEAVIYLPELDQQLWAGTTIRHLLTHTHGLRETDEGTIREFPTGQGWAYRQIGVRAMAEIIKRTTGKTISSIIHEQVFNPLNFSESGWYAHKHKKLADVILKEGGDRHWHVSESTDGDRMNMYVSARELAYWGYLHLKEGYVNGKQLIPKELIQMAVSLQSPPLEDKDLPQNGFFWFVKDLPALQTEIGAAVPKGSYQILGYTGVTLLVIPEYRLTAVRMYNSFGSPLGFDYLDDVRSFGDTVMSCLKN